MFFWILEEHQFVVPWECRAWNRCSTFNFSLGLYLLTADVMGFNCSLCWRVPESQEITITNCCLPLSFHYFLHCFRSCQKNFSQPENSYQKKSLTDWEQFAKGKTGNHWQEERRATEPKPAFHKLKV